MEQAGFINGAILCKISNKLQGSELKMLMLILMYLSVNNKSFVINNEAWRKYMSDSGFSVTPERTCSLLSSLTKKDILHREGRGVYSVADNLYMPAAIGNKIFE